MPAFKIFLKSYNASRKFDVSHSLLEENKKMARYDIVTGTKEGLKLQ